MDQRGGTSGRGFLQVHVDTHYPPGRTPNPYLVRVHGGDRELRDVGPERTLRSEGACGDGTGV